MVKKRAEPDGEQTLRIKSIVNMVQYLSVFLSGQITLGPPSGWDHRWENVANSPGALCFNHSPAVHDHVTDGVLTSGVNYSSVCES